MSRNFKNRASKKFSAVKNNAFNIASGTRTNLKDLAEEIQKLMGVTAPISTGENRTGEVMRYVGNIDKAKQGIGLQARNRPF